MLQPKRVKYRKAHRGSMGGLSKGGNTLAFGEYGLKALEASWITQRQLEAARRAITHQIKRGGQLWIRIFPDKPVTARPLETRMGGGKGAVDHWGTVIKPGRILFELAGIKEEDAKEAFRLAGHKLPIATKFVSAALVQTEGQESV